MRQLRHLPTPIRQVRPQTLPIMHHRLVPARMVEDAQPTMNKRHVNHRAIRTRRAIAKPTLAVRPAMQDAIVQNVQPSLGDGLQRVRHHRPGLMDPKYTGNTAHGGGL